VGSSGGSADAILSGLVQESWLQDQARRRESDVRIEDIRSTYEGRRKRSLLDFAGHSVTLGNRFAGSPGRAGACSIERWRR
jgi:hypothetical protein